MNTAPTPSDPPTQPPTEAAFSWRRGRRRPRLGLLRNQPPLDLHLPLQGVDLGVSSFDQPDKLANHARAFASKGGER
ncbi:hypothetical protein [Comamonas guangdongensis]|uniref:Uncharacterized protein n=1 Tax=Comamonas guangdongensis TaxID=510515 RepID=A0ABV3ZSL7_9BURK